MLYSENAKIINVRNWHEALSSTQPYELKGSTMGSVMTLLRVYLKIGVGVYKTP